MKPNKKFQVKENKSFIEAMDLLEEIVYVSDLDTYELLFLNEAGKKVYSDRIGEKCYEILQKGQTKPCDFCTNHKLLDENGNPNKPYVWEFQNTITKQWYHIIDKVIQLENKKLVRLEIAKNITDTKQSHKNLSETILQSELVMESANIGWWDWDISSGDEKYNKILPELLGYELDEIEPHISWWEAKIHKDDLPQVGIDLEAHFEGKTMFYSNEHRLLTKSGEWKWFLDYGRVVERDEENKPIRMIGTLRNIEEQKKAQENLKYAKEKAEEGDRLKTEFINNMSHEIRTPMNGILGFSKLLEHTDLSEAKRKHYINIIQNSGSQLMHVIDDILEISKLGTKQVKVFEKEVCLNDLLLEHFSLFSIKAKENKTPLYLIKGLSDKDSLIFTDETKLNKILSNLLENALKFTSEGFVEFGYHLISESSEVELYVKDTGRGIKQEKQKAIFERFSQEERSLERNVGGLGLGLSIAKENAELLGGKITLKSEKEKGATFFVTIPYQPVKSKAEDNKTKNGIVNEKTEEDEYTILIVEDEEVNYLYLDTLLENAKLNLKTLHAKHGQEAVEICKENAEIDFVLMDMKMPVMNGFEATKLIKKIRPDLPIVAQTAYSTTEEKAQALTAGCDDFISKPISEETLNELINKCLIS